MRDDPSDADGRHSRPASARADGGRARGRDDGRSDETLAGASESDVDGQAGRSRDALRLDIERLRERNEQLQTTYARARKAEYRRAALGMATLGVVAVAGAAVVPVVRTILLVLGATGLFGAVLTYYLTPERFVAAAVGRGVYRATAADRRALAAELGLADRRVYVPVAESGPRVRLFVPQFEEYTIPPDAELAETLVVPDDETGRGVSFTPTGRDLYESFTEAVSGDPEADPRVLTTQLCDALVEQFELVVATDVDYDTGERRVTVSVEGSVYGPADSVDHPVVSVLAVGLARSLDEPVVADATGPDGDGSDFVVTYRWDRSR
jgi:hypothetical protein